MGDESHHAKDDLAKQVLGVGYDELDDIKKSTQAEYKVDPKLH